MVETTFAEPPVNLNNRYYSNAYSRFMTPNPRKSTKMESPRPRVWPDGL
jgi:hypothetical protein